MLHKSILLTSLLFCFTAYAKDNSHTIAHIEEASGISYCQNSNTLMVANDEGTFYELSLDGAILASHKLGDYDLEGVVCHDDKIAFGVENKGLLIVNRDTLKQKHLKLKGKKFKLSKKAGIEGLAYHNGIYYLAIQTKKAKDAKILLVKATKNYAKITKILDHGIIDTAGLQYIDKHLYMVSDKKNTLYIYSLKTNTITKQVKLDKFAQEGIAIVGNDVYFADDDGTVKRYTVQELRLGGM